jgi:hypothetical protein
MAPGRVDCQTASTLLDEVTVTGTRISPLLDEVTVTARRDASAIGLSIALQPIATVDFASVVSMPTFGLAQTQQQRMTQTGDCATGMTGVPLNGAVGTEPAIVCMSDDEIALNAKIVGLISAGIAGPSVWMTLSTKSRIEVIALFVKVIGGTGGRGMPRAPALPRPPPPSIEVPAASPTQPINPYFVP